jgi:prolyl-tRNA editing enzyme YbaK/EbsC (Cys-tRNA(Pro) deacylase)
MSYHPFTQTLQTFLTEHNVPFKTYEHEPVRTSEEAAKLRPEYTLKQGAKAMIIQAKREGQKQFVMLVLPGDKKFDSRKVKTILASNNIRFAFPEELKKITKDILPGGVAPFGNLFNIPVIADIGIFENETIIFNAGDKSFSIAMKSEDYKKIVNPRIEDIT